MAAKKKQQFKLIGESFEKELIDIIDLRITENQKEVTENDIKKIVKELFNDIDVMISNKIKNHMKFLGETLIEKSKQE